MFHFPPFLTSWISFIIFLFLQSLKAIKRLFFLEYIIILFIYQSIFRFIYLFKGIRILFISLTR